MTEFTTGYSNEPPFASPGWEQAWAREMEEHEHDYAMPWPLERARDYLRNPDKLENGDVQYVTQAMPELRAIVAELDACRRQLTEARELGRLLLAAGLEQAEDLGFLQEYDVDLAHELLPAWLTSEPGAPEEWQTPARDADAERDAADIEHDPDLGKDLDYDDEDERTTDADYEIHDDEYEMDHDENGWPK